MKKTILHGRPDFKNPTQAYDNVDIKSVFKLFFKILKPERKFYVVTIIYGVVIALLTLAAPISVQALVSTVANTALAGPVIVLASILFILLTISGILNALQTYIMELFERHFFARITSEIVLQNIYAQTVYFKSINRAELVNRYFDIMTIQKNMPSLLIDGFALILQAIVGLVVVSSYHPALFVFNVVFVISIYLMWSFWGHKAVRTGLSFSNTKYNVARWLEELARNNAEFKSHDRIIFALNKSEHMADEYMHHRKSHFNYTFRQTVGFLFIYAIFSAALLGIGGLLVIQGQLSLGQLVAAELILTAVFIGLSRAGLYLKQLYEMIPAAEKISHFFRIPTEVCSGEPFEPDKPFQIIFKNAVVSYRREKLVFDLDIPAGAKIMAAVSSSFMQDYFIELIEGHRPVDSGFIMFGDKDISTLNPHSYRDKVVVIDDALLLEGTIEEYLRFGNPNATEADITHILAALKLDKIINDLPNGIRTSIIHTGYPLSTSEGMRLKLAATLLAKPKALILTEAFDIMGYNVRQKVFSYLCSQEDLTLIYFTNRRDSPYFKKYLYLTPDTDYLFDKIDDLREISRRVSED